MAGFISLRVLAPGPAAATYGVLGGDYAAAVGVHSSPWRPDALCRFVWLGDDYCPGAGGFDRVCRQTLALSEPRTTMLRTLATAIVAVALAVFTQWQSHRFDQTRGLVSSGQKSLHVIQALRSLNLHPNPGSTILLKPETRFYQNGYYPLFVASLVWNDHSLRIYVAGQPHLTQQQIANMSYVISFNQLSAKLVRAAEPDRS